MVEMLDEFFEHLELKYGPATEHFVRVNKMVDLFLNWRRKGRAEADPNKLHPQHRFKRIVKGGRVERREIPSERERARQEARDKSPARSEGRKIESRPVQGNGHGQARKEAPAPVKSVAASPDVKPSPGNGAAGAQKTEGYFGQRYPYYPEYPGGYPMGYHHYYPPPPTQDAYWPDPKAAPSYPAYPPAPPQGQPPQPQDAYSQYYYPPYTPHPPQATHDYSVGQPTPPVQPTYPPYGYPYYYHYPPPPAYPTPPAAPRDPNQPKPESEPPQNHPKPVSDHAYPPPYYPPYPDPATPHHGHPKPHDPPRQAALEPSEPSLTSSINHQRSSQSPNKHRGAKSQKMSRIDDLFSKLVP